MISSKFSTLFTSESIDFAMLVFLWIVQIIIYPSFKEVAKNRILIWHKNYQSKVCIIMGPIMLLQIYMITVGLMTDSSTLSIIRFILLMASWFLTVFISVPLHKKIESNNDLEGSIERLIQTNLFRTFTWTAIYLTHLI